MAMYDGTYSCGHEGRVNVIGPGKDRQWKADAHFRGLCPECWEQKKLEEREKANAEAAKKAKEMELPVLEGTEKQVAWANTLRQDLIDKIDALGRKEMECINSTEGEKYDVLDYIMSQTKASWFIDNRPHGILSWIEDRLTAIIAWKADQEVKPLVEEMKIESTVQPENCQYKEPAEIKVSSEKITVSFPKNENFRELVKSLGYTWGDGYWYRKITKFNGPADDRAAELGNKLLNAGFPITVTDNIIRQNAVSGNYQPEQKRWIMCRLEGTYKNWFAITWSGRDENLYKVARKLPGSKWDNSSVVVKVNYWQEVQDFAELYGFKFSDMALDAIETHRNIEVTKVKPAESKEEIQNDGLKDILNSGDDILDDLKD
jgi:hypothetical protein